MIAAYRRRALTGTRSEMRRDAVPIVAFLMVLLAWDFVGVDWPIGTATLKDSSGASTG
jgi:hypothetical protein